MLLTKSQNYLKKQAIKVSNLPVKIRDIFTSMEEFNQEYQALGPDERKQFAAFIGDTDKEVLAAMEKEYPQTDIQTIIKERLTDDASLKALDAYLNSLKQTQDKYKKKGKYTATRLKIHNRIIEHFTKFVPVPNMPTNKLKNH